MYKFFEQKIAVVLAMSISALLATTSFAADSREDKNVIECDALYEIASSGIRGTKV